MKFAKILASAAVLMAAATAVVAADANPALIYDLGGKFDKSFNEASFNGAERFKTETGIGYKEFELQTDAQREQALRRFAEQGYNPVVVTGFSFGSALETVASEFPDTHFVIIDMVVDQPNVRSVVFNEHEGSYLVGVLAAMASKTGTVGFVGGMDIPLIQKFACGYVQGVKADQPRRQGDPEHDRHHRRCLERPGARRRARQEPDRPGRRRGLPRRRRHRHRRAAGGGRRRRARHRRRFQPELPAPGPGADLDAQARRRRRPTPR